MGLAAELHQQRKERYARWKASAVEDHGIDLKRKKLASHKPAFVTQITHPPKPPIPNESVVRVLEVPVLRKPTATAILRAISSHYLVSIADLKSPTRRLSVCYPRQIAAFLMVRFAKLSMPNSGRHLGNRDHTTILHACRKIESDQRFNADLISKIEAIKAEIIAGRYHD